MLGVGHSVDLGKSGETAEVEIWVQSAAAELVAVGLGFYRFVCSAVVFEPDQGVGPIAADTGQGH